MSTGSAQDGIINPGAALGIAPFVPVFAAAVPISSYLTTPGGLFEKVFNGFISASTFVGTAGSQSTVASDRVIPALATVYLFSTFALGGASSAAAIAAGNPEGRSNNTPRAQVSNLRGMPLRAHSAAAHLMEVFPAFALAAGLAQTLAPTNQHIVNLLGLHVIAKLLIFWPSYIFDVDATRSIGHVLATGSIVGVAYKLTFL